MINKDQSIVTQVAAKIAADLTPKSEDILKNIENWMTAFDACTDALLKAHNVSITADAPATPAPTTAEAVAIVQQAFPNATVQSSGMTVRIKGKQHGPMPEWLGVACANKGVSEVWDNRDGLSANPKRPWFKSTTSDDAFWPPRGK